MQPTLDIIAPLSRILQCPLHEALPADIKAVAEMMPGNVDSEVLAAELEVFANILSNSQEPSEDKLTSGDRVIQLDRVIQVETELSMICVPSYP